MHPLILIVGLGILPLSRSVVGLQTSECFIAPAKNPSSVDQVPTFAILMQDELQVRNEQNGETITYGAGRLVQAMAGSVAPVDSTIHDWLDPA